MAQSKIEADLFVSGTLTAQNFNPPSASIDDDAISAPSSPGDAIAATKLEHQFPVFHAQKTGTDVTTETMPVHIVQGDAATLVSFEVRPITAPTGGDKQFTVDLQKGSDAGSFSTVLSAVITVDNSSVDNTLQAASFASTSLTDGDALQIVVTTSGSTGSQGQGFVAVAFVREDPST